MATVLPDHMSNVLPDHVAHAPGVGSDEGPRPRLDDGVVGAREGAVQQQAEQRALLLFLQSGWASI